MDRRRVRARYFRLLNASLNRVTRRAARAGRGPWSLVRHVGRRSGRTYETPLLLARVPEGFVAELTYGPGVDWYRNIVAAGGCVVVHRGVEHRIDRIEPCPAEVGLRAFANPSAFVLRVLRRREFRVLHEAGAGS
jgi:deazaflavin-dependent oxidoreductase (nitroreductase family)